MQRDDGRVIDQVLQLSRRPVDVRADQASESAEGLSMDLDRALATLKEPVRLCIVLSYHEGMTHDEIADFTNLPVGTVKSHIRRGTKRLQEELKEYLA